MCCTVGVESFGKMQRKRFLANVTDGLRRLQALTIPQLVYFCWLGSDRTLEGRLAIAALQMALRHRSPTAGQLHHSDRGMQYACKNYTDVLKEHRIAISMIQCSFRD